MIVIVDYGMGNLGSIANMLKKIGVAARISSREEDIVSADKLILPGVGAFDNGMNSLRMRGLDKILEKRVLQDGIPILGICLGMQLFTEKSEEGVERGLGWIEGETIRFCLEEVKQSLKVPHMGWNEVLVNGSSPLFTHSDAIPRFYFVHSYHVRCAHPSDVAATSTYGIDFTSAIHRNNIYGTQFHPEKSHKYGMTLLKNFVENA